jgi:hypothetical protein
MNLKKILLLIISMVFINANYAQGTKVENLWNGPKKFILGSDKSKFALDLKWIGADTSGTKKSYAYDYVPATNLPFVLEGVEFKSIRLYFDERNKLYWVEMTAVFDKTDSTTYIKEAEAGSKKIIFHLNDKLKKTAEEKYNYNTVKFNAVNNEWKKGNNTITLSSLEDKTHGHEFVNLTLRFSTSQNDAAGH